MGKEGTEEQNGTERQPGPAPFGEFHRGQDGKHREQDVEAVLLAFSRIVDERGTDGEEDRRRGRGRSRGAEAARGKRKKKQGRKPGRKQGHRENVVAPARKPAHGPFHQTESDRGRLAETERAEEQIVEGMGTQSRLQSVDVAPEGLGPPQVEAKQRTDEKRNGQERRRRGLAFRGGSSPEKQEKGQDGGETDGDFHRSAEQPSGMESVFHDLVGPPVARDPGFRTGDRLRVAGRNEQNDKRRESEQRENGQGGTRFHLR